MTTVTYSQRVFVRPHLPSRETHFLRDLIWGTVPIRLSIRTQKQSQPNSQSPATPRVHRLCSGPAAGNGL